MNKWFNRSRKAGCWLALAAIFVVGLLLWWALPQQAAGALLVVVLGFLAAFALYSGWQKFSRAAHHQRLRAVATGCTWAAVGLMCLSAYYFRPEAIDDQLAGIVWMLLGGLFLLFAQGARYGALQQPVFSEDENQSSTINAAVVKGAVRWPRIAQMGLGVGALTALTVMNLPAPPAPLQAVPVHVQVALLVGGVALFAWGLAGASLSALPISFPSRSSFLNPLFLLTVLAFALRVWSLEDAVHIFVDEFHSAEAVTRLGLESDIRILTAYNPLAAFPWLFPYAQSGAAAVFGHTLFGLRIVSVIIGTLTIPALYGLAKYLFDRRTALLSALFLATFPPHIHFSRLALINIVDPFLGTLALAFLACALSTTRRRDYILAGLCLGLTQYFYEGGKLLFPALSGCWLLALFLFRRGRLSPRGLLLLLLMAAVVIAPLYATLAAWDAPLFPRLELQGEEGAGLMSSSYLGENLLPPLLHLVHLPDTSEFYYGGQTPLILGYLVPLFFLGLFAALWRWRVSGLLVLGWVALAALGNSLLQTGMTAWSARYVVVLPALALLLALGLRFTLPLLVPRINWDSASSDPGAAAFGCGVFRAQSVLLSAFIVLLAALPPLYYFTAHLPVYNEQIRPYRDHIDALYRARLLPAGTSIIFVTGDPVYQPHYDVLAAFWNFAPPVSVIDPADFSRDYLSQLAEGGYAFFIDQENDIAPAILRVTFAAVDGPLYSPYQVPPDRQYALYYRPPPAS